MVCGCPGFQDRRIRRPRHERTDWSDDHSRRIDAKHVDTNRVDVNHVDPQHLRSSNMILVRCRERYFEYVYVYRHRCASIRVPQVPD